MDISKVMKSENKFPYNLPSEGNVCPGCGKPVTRMTLIHNWEKFMRILCSACEFKMQLRERPYKRLSHRVFP